LQTNLDNLSKQFASPSCESIPVAAVPYEKRTVARLGCLGWDSPKELILKRAQEVLDAARAPCSAYLCLSAVVWRDGKGSSAELKLNSAEELHSARLSVQAQSKEYITGKKVWLDAKKESSEMHARKMVHRTHDYLEEAESKQRAPCYGSKISS